MRPEASGCVYVSPIQQWIRGVPAEMLGKNGKGMGCCPVMKSGTFLFFSISACFQNEGRLNGENLQGFDYLHIAHSREANLFNHFEHSNFRGNAEGTAL